MMLSRRLDDAEMMTSRCWLKFPAAFGAWHVSDHTDAAMGVSLEKSHYVVQLTSRLWDQGLSPWAFSELSVTCFFFCFVCFPSLVSLCHSHSVLTTPEPSSTSPLTTPPRYASCAVTSSNSSTARIRCAGGAVAMDTWASSPPSTFNPFTTANDPSRGSEQAVSSMWHLYPPCTAPPLCPLTFGADDPCAISSSCQRASSNQLPQARQSPDPVTEYTNRDLNTDSSGELAQTRQRPRGVLFWGCDGGRRHRVHLQPDADSCRWTCIKTFLCKMHKCVCVLLKWPVRHCPSRGHSLFQVHCKCEISGYLFRSVCELI